MNLDWYEGFQPENRCVVFYDELLSDPLAVLKSVLNFLEVSVSGNTLHCVLDRKEGIYKRSKKKLTIEVFTNGMKGFLEERRKNVYKLLQKNMANNTTMPEDAKNTHQK